MLNNNKLSSITPKRIKTEFSRRIPVFMLAGLIGLIASGISPVYANSPTLPHDMICDTNGQRPDKNNENHEYILKTPDGSIAYYRFGHGSPIVLVTGYRSGIDEWNAYFLGALAEQHEVIVFDNRGIGRSTSTSKSNTIVDMAADTAQLIKALHLHNVTLVGWSMGGMIAQQLALDEPDLISKLVLLSTMPPGNKGAPINPEIVDILSGQGADHFNKVMEILFPASLAARAKQCFVKDMFSPADYQATVISDAVTKAQKIVMDKWNQDNNAFTQLHDLTTPTLILGGNDDKVIVPANSALLNSALPHATRVQFPNAGHAMMYQYPQLLAQDIEKFVRKKTP